jgi:hypothetical protein
MNRYPHYKGAHSSKDSYYRGPLLSRYARFEVFMAVKLQLLFFCIEMSCGDVVSSILPTYPRTIQLHGKELHNVYTSNIIMVTKSRRMK